MSCGSKRGQDIHIFEKKSSSGRRRAQMKPPEKKLIFLRHIDYNRKYHVLLHLWSEIMNKGFSCTVEDEKILEYMKLSVVDKLTWLEEINKFNELYLGEKEKKIRDKLRRGEI
jgi:hypothetical protein